MTEALAYNARVRDHFERPRNVANGPWPGCRTGEAGSVERGAWIGFQLQLDADGVVQGLRFRAFGCPHTIALGSWLTGFLTGGPLPRDLALDRESVMQALDLPVEKTHCLLLAEDALRRAMTTEDESDSLDDGGR